MTSPLSTLLGLVPSTPTGEPPTPADYERLHSLGLMPHWLEPPRRGDERSGKNPGVPEGKGWQLRPWTDPLLVAPRNGCNLGLQTGHVEGTPEDAPVLIVVDCDSREALAWAEENLPPTPLRALTGPTKTDASIRGQHRYYRLAPGQQAPKNGVKITVPGVGKLALDVKSTGGQVVCPPSLHYSGVFYEWLEGHPTVEMLASLPVFQQQWLGLGAAAKLASLPGGDEPTRPGMTDEQIDAAIEAALVDTTVGLLPQHAEVLHAALAGTSYASIGSHECHAKRRDLTFAMAIVCAAATDDEILAYVWPSSERSTANPEAALADLRTTLRGARSNPDRVLADRAKLDTKFVGAIEGMKARLAAQGEAQAQAAEGDRLLVARHPGGAAAFHLRDGGGYSGAISCKVLYQQAGQHDVLGWAGRPLTVPTKNGDRPMKEGEFFNAYATLIENYYFDHTVVRNTFVPETKTFIEAPSKVQHHEPEYSPVMEQYLRIVAGPHYDRLCDWLALLPNTKVGLPLLALLGPKDVGKDFFINSLSRLWFPSGVRAPDLASIAEGFQQAICESPLLIANETMPTKIGGSNAWEKLRDLTTKGSHTVNRKNLPVVPVRGYLRFLFAANDLTKIELAAGSIEAREALIGRILCLEVPQAAAKFLADMGEAQRTALADNGGFARHVRWLEQEYVAKHGEPTQKRGLVPGNGETFIAQASTNDPLTDNLLESIWAVISDTSHKLPADARRYCIARPDGVWVSAKLFAQPELFTMLVPSRARSGSYSITAIGRGLSMLVSHGRKAQTLNVPRTKVSQPEGAATKREQAIYHPLAGNLLVAWGTRNISPDAEAMLENFLGGLTPEPPTDTDPTPPPTPTRKPASVVTRLLGKAAAAQAPAASAKAPAPAQEPSQAPEQYAVLPLAEVEFHAVNEPPAEPAAPETVEVVYSVKPEAPAPVEAPAPQPEPAPAPAPHPVTHTLRDQIVAEGKPVTAATVVSAAKARAAEKAAAKALAAEARAAAKAEKEAQAQAKVEARAAAKAAVAAAKAAQLPKAMRPLPERPASYYTPATTEAPGWLQTLEANLPETETEARALLREPLAALMANADAEPTPYRRATAGLRAYCRSLQSGLDRLQALRAADDAAFDRAPIIEGTLGSDSPDNNTAPAHAPSNPEVIS